MAQFSSRVQRVVLHDDGSQAQDRIERDDVLRTVRQHQRHPVPRDDPLLAQSVRDPLNPLPQLGVGRLPPEELQRDLFRIAGDGCRE